MKSSTPQRTQRTQSPLSSHLYPLPSHLLPFSLSPLSRRTDIIDKIDEPPPQWHIPSLGLPCAIRRSRLPAHELPFGLPCAVRRCRRHCRFRRCAASRRSANGQWPMGIGCLLNGTISLPSTFAPFARWRCRSADGSSASSPRRPRSRRATRCRRRRGGSYIGRGERIAVRGKRYLNSWA